MSDAASKRTIGDVDYSQLSHHAMRLLAETQVEGNNKYTRESWRKSKYPLSNLLSHALEHIFKFQNGEMDDMPKLELHLGHALWNLSTAIHWLFERPGMVDLVLVRERMNIGLPVVSTDLQPADPAPEPRTTNCWFCGCGVNPDNPKVIPSGSKYAQSHTGCFINATTTMQKEFNNGRGKL